MEQTPIPSWSPSMGLIIYQILSHTEKTQTWQSTPDASVRVMGVVIDLLLLAAFLPIQPSMQLAAFTSWVHCWLMLFAVCQHPTVISYTAALYPVKSQLLTGLYLSRCRTWHLPLLNFLRYMTAHFSRLYLFQHIDLSSSGIIYKLVNILSYCSGH